MSDNLHDLRNGEMSLPLSDIFRALDTLASEPTCRNLGKLQSNTNAFLDTFGEDLRAFEVAVTALFVSAKFDFVTSLSADRFIELVRQMTPELLDEQLVDDCDADGNPLYDGATLRPEVDLLNLTSKSRAAFLSRAGMGLVNVVPVPPVEIERLKVVLSDVVNERMAAILNSYRNVQKHRTESFPMMSIPRFP